jgi:hypothetical protein
MSWFRRFWRHRASRERIERDLHDELRATFDLLVDAYVKAGMPLAAAERAARVSLGSVEAIKDNVRDQRTGTFVDTVARDAWFGARLLVRSPLFAVTAIATVALGLGLNAALFTIFNGLVFRADAVAEPHSLYRFTWSSRAARSHAFTWREYERVRSENDVFADVLARRIDVVSRIEGRHAFGHLVSANFVRVLRVSPRLGRLLQPSDNAPGAPPAVVLSFHAWNALYGSDVRIVGERSPSTGINARLSAWRLRDQRIVAHDAVRRPLHGRQDRERAKNMAPCLEAHDGRYP